MILIVEDNPIVRVSLELAVKSEGHDVITAKNGYEAFSIIMSQKINVVLSDINMPIVNGLQLLKKVKNVLAFENMPFWVFLTGNSKIPYKTESDRLGADHFIMKPYDHNHVLNLIRVETRKRA